MIDYEACLNLHNIAQNKYAVMMDIKNDIDKLAKEVQQMLPRGYWYSYDVDTSWKRPKKYSIKKVEGHAGGMLITVKEVFKKKPWPSFTGEHTYYLTDFLKLNIHKTEQEAIDWYTHRICPKCGGYMGYSDRPWCTNCMKERAIVMENYNNSHRFYDPKTQDVYDVKYVDELTRVFGFNGEWFTIRRKDTGEIIRTNNVWSCGSGYNSDNLPEIEFITEEQ